MKVLLYLCVGSLAAIALFLIALVYVVEGWIGLLVLAGAMALAQPAANLGAHFGERTGRAIDRLGAAIDRTLERRR